MGRTRALLRALRRRWRRSLQTRVVATTLLLSLVVLSGVGLFVLDRVGHGLVASQRAAALTETAAGLRYSQSQLAQADRTDAQSLDLLFYSVAGTLDGQGGPAGLYDVALLPTAGGAASYSSRPFDTDDVPPSLRETVARDHVEAYAYTTITRGGGRVHALVVGAPVSTDYELYYVFPLGDQEETLSLVRRALAVGGLALAVLLAGIAALVARQVVTPVRLAAAVAARFSSGHLEERMAVTGEDELSKLASSFNAMARSLQRQIGQLEELSRVQRRFTADVSHELRTPLTTVRMAADVLHDGRRDFPPETARAAELLQGELDRFERLLVDLLEISRYDAKAATLDCESVDVAGLVRSVVEAARPLAERRGVAIDTSRVPGEPVVAEADPRRVQRVVRNLVANAIEYGEGRPVELVVGADEHSVGVVVRDHGVGLRAGQETLVFNRFWRADPSRARETGGTGLGLSIALEDARLHGGWLQAWGYPGAGAAFRLTLPRRNGVELRSSPVPLGASRRRDQVRPS